MLLQVRQFASNGAFILTETDFGAMQEEEQRSASEGGPYGREKHGSEDPPLRDKKRR